MKPLTALEILGWAGERKGHAARHRDRHTRAAIEATERGDELSARANLSAAGVWSGRESAFGEVVERLRASAKAERKVKP